MRTLRSLRRGNNAFNMRSLRTLTIGTNGRNLRRLSRELEGDNRKQSNGSNVRIKESEMGNLRSPMREHKVV